jgi:hypothetical protein
MSSSGTAARPRSRDAERDYAKFVGVSVGIVKDATIPECIEMDSDTASAGLISLCILRQFAHHLHCSTAIIKSNNTTRPKALTSTMLSSLSFMLVVYMALSSTVTAHVMLNNPRFIPNQQPLQEPLAVLTTTLHTTVTSYASTSMITATLTRYTADGTTDVPAAVQTWYSAQRAEGCDRTACASCRVWYSCEGFGALW